jgi:beta-xylosidase
MKTTIFAIAAAVFSVPAFCQSTYTNPVLWEDLADIDVFRVGNEYYYSASTMAFSPGAPILKSGDLVNWKYIGHSVPRLDFGNPAAYSLDNGLQAYVKGIWASSMRYRASNKTWYWIGCVQSSGKTYIYTASDPTAKWGLASTINTCYYDCGLLFDDKDDIYVAYGNTKLSVAQLNKDLTQKSNTLVYSASFYLEGARMYQIKGKYYIFVTKPADQQWMLKSTGGPLGPYELKIFADKVNPGIPNAGKPHQGGIVDTPNGDWYYLGFEDAYPGGRMPTLSPFTWDSNGWPVLPSKNSFATANKYPVTPVPVEPYARSQTFQGPSLSPEWEWNHNPDTSGFTFASGGGLVLKTASVTNDLFRAKNTLTHRITGPASAATIRVDISKMAAGDRAGLALFRDNMAYIAVEGGKISLWKNLALGTGWNTISTGQVEASATLPSGSKEVWFKLNANIAPASNHQGTFSWSSDGKTFQQLGTPYTMNTTYYFFIGYRFGILNYATKSLGGSVTVKSFDITKP